MNNAVSRTQEWSRGHNQREYMEDQSQMVRREEHRRWWSDPANVPIIVRSICSSWSSDKYYTQNHIIRMRQAEMHRMTGSASWYAESFTSDSDTDIFHRYLNRNIKNGGN